MKVVPIIVCLFLPQLSEILQLNTKKLRNIEISEFNLMNFEICSFWLLGVIVTADHYAQNLAMLPFFVFTPGETGRLSCKKPNISNNVQIN